MDTDPLEPEPYSSLIHDFNLLIVSAFDFKFYISIGILLLLIISSALVSGSEVAFFSLNEKSISKLRDSKHSNEKSIISLLKKPRTLLASILIANNIINISIIILFTVTVSSYYQFNSPVLSFIIEVVVITFILVIFGELLPKMYASQKNLSFAKFMALPFTFITKMLYPLALPLVKSTKFIEKRLEKRSSYLSIQDIKEAIDLTSKQEQNPGAGNILRNIVNFGNVYVKQIMTSRVNVVAFDYHDNFKEILTSILDNKFSRVPVFQDSPDNIIGLLYIKDLIPHFEKGKDFKWQNLIRKAYFVPEIKKIDDLLKEFQDKKVHMAIVVDEYGGFSGIITLEDILEEIVGEITDEFDEEEENQFRKINDNTYVFDARTQLNDLVKHLKTDEEFFDKVKGDAETLGGLMIEMLGKIPLKGEKTHYKNLNFVIEKSDRKRVKEVKIIIQPE